MSLKVVLDSKKPSDPAHMHFMWSILLPCCYCCCFHGPCCLSLVHPWCYEWKESSAHRNIQNCSFTKVCKITSRCKSISIKPHLITFDLTTSQHSISPNITSPHLISYCIVPDHPPPLGIRGTTCWRLWIVASFREPTRAIGQMCALIRMARGFMFGDLTQVEWPPIFC